MTISSFQKKVWGFYSKNKRAFPWRETSNPYHILVSEIMLQQTQVNRVLPKYIEFLKQFPKIEDLAKVSNETVLRLWSGLGYNRRALYLKNAAEKLSQNPNYTPENLSLLKGIGKNTAGAIYVFSFNKPYVFIETNIRRVFIHEFFPNREKVDDKGIMKLIQKTLDQKNPREWYYGLMDYGASLAKTEINPNRKSKQYAKQSTFEGSLRQTRGQILKILIRDRVCKLPILEKKIESSHFQKAIKDLQEEKFIKVNPDTLFVEIV